MTYEPFYYVEVEEWSIPNVFICVGGVTNVVDGVSVRSSSACYEVLVELDRRFHDQGERGLIFAQL